MDPILKRPDGLSDDEWRLVRLFRRLHPTDRSNILRHTAERLLAKYPLASYYFSKDPKKAAENELNEEIDWRLRLIQPSTLYITDLCDYDWHIEEEGWPEGVADVLLGSSDDDDNAAESLVEAYLEGARRYDVPLQTDFRDAECSLEEAEKDMREDLYKEALKFIEVWREEVVTALEIASSQTNA